MALDFSSLPFQFVQEESGGQYLPIDLGNGQQVFKTASGYEISGPSGGSIYDSEGNLVNTYERTGSKTGIIKDTAGNVVGSIDSSSRLNQALGSVFDPLAPAIPAVLGSLVLGPAGAGIFSAPTAAAVASGGNTLLQGGSVEDALKAAALAGAGAFGAEQVTGLLNNAAYDLSFAAADAAQLANQGLNASAIAQNLVTYVDPATAVSLANTAVTQSFALADANQLTQQGLSQNQVAQVLENSGLNANTAANIAQAAADGVTTLTASDIIPEVQFQRQSNLNQGLLSPADAEQVMVTGQAFDIPNISQLGQGVGAALSTAPLQTAQAPVQRAEVEGTRESTTQTPALPIASAALPQTTTVTGQNIQANQQDTAPAATAGLLTTTTQTAPTQQVETTGQREVKVEDRLIPTITTAPIIQAQPGESVSVEGKREPVETATAVIPSTAAGVTAPAQPTTITAKDAALAGLLLAGAGSLGGGGQPGEPVSGPVSGVIPGYPGRGDYQMPGMFQIAPTNVYNPFATVAPFGAGRFGAVNQPITLPYGLLASGPIGLMAGINQPTRGLV